MDKLIRNFYYNILWLLPKDTATKIRYRIATHHKLDLKDPKDFNQKVLYLLVKKYGERETKCADKYLMRDYIKEKGLDSFLPKLYGVYDDAKKINFSELPEEYVLKPNNGCGNVIIHKKGDSIDKEEVIKKLNKALKRNFAKKTLEYQYKDIKPLIICEEYLKEDGMINPIDYKFYGFRGHVECILLCTERENRVKWDYYDTNWNKLDYSKEIYRSNKEHKRPQNLDKMIEVASKLSEDFPFVRVDLYNINGKIYIGEMTFTPCAGIIKDITQEALDYLGKLIKI